MQGVWKKGHIKEHAETHIEGVDKSCHICNNTLSDRPALQHHIRDIHCGINGHVEKYQYY